MQARPVEQDQIDIANERSHIRAQIANSVATALAALNLTGYLYMAGSEMLVPLLNAVGKFIFFPFAALTSILYAVFAWYHWSIKRDSKHLLIKAILETIGAVVMTAAVIGYLAFAPLFAVAGPIMFAVFLGMKTIFQLGTAIFYGCKVMATDNHVKKNEYRNKVKHAVLSTVAGALTTVGLIAVELLAAPYLSIIGILAGAFATACAVVRIIDSVIKLHAVDHLQEVVRDANGDLEVVRSSQAIVMAELNRDHVREYPREADIAHDELSIPMHDMTSTLAEEPLPAVMHLTEREANNARLMESLNRNGVAEYDDEPVGYNCMANFGHSSSESSVEVAVPAPLIPHNDDVFEEVPLAYDSDEIVFSMRK